WMLNVGCWARRRRGEVLRGVWNSLRPCGRLNIRRSTLNIQHPTMCVLLALIFLAQTACIFAAGEVKANDAQAMRESRDTVIVPYDPKKPVKDQHPDKVYLNYDRFLELWEAAKKSRTPEKQPFAAAAYALGAARYEGRVEEKRAV